MARTVVPRANGEQTREKILTVAERLFAAAGFDGVSMRDVGAAADVPFALVTYHFGSKLGLYEAVFKRRNAWIQADRADRLRAIELGDDPRANFAAIARAFVEPSLRVRELEGGREFGRVMAREINDPAEGERGIVEKYLDPTTHIVIDLLQRAAPDAPRARVYWALEFAAAALAWSHADTGRVERLSGGRATSDNLDGLIDELTHFVTVALLGSLRPDAALSAQPADRPRAAARRGTARAKATRSPM